MTNARGRGLYEFETCKLDSNGNITGHKLDTVSCFREELENDVFIDMILIPTGKFRNIVIPPFFISATLITQEQWKAFPQQGNSELTFNPSEFQVNGAKRPVENVNWWMAEEFCKRLTFTTNLDYRLPSEAQWEYACRAATTTEYYFGDSLSANVANYDNSIRETTEVRKYFANAWGLYDMHGNIGEWCADHYSNDFEESLKDSNPIVSDNDQANRVVRGGSWILDPLLCASSYRSHNSPMLANRSANDIVGFRIVCS